MTSDVGALSLPGRRDPLDKTLKLLGKSLGRRISGLGRLEKMARRLPCRAAPADYAEACLTALEINVDCAPEEMARIPPHGPLLFYANHPSGALEGLIRDARYGGVRSDLKILANDALLSLPGVGRKSANLIMGDVFGKPAIVTDTHCIRLVNRIGLVDWIKDPKKVEMALWKIIPPEEGSALCHRFVCHGRDVCTARTTPHCERCCLQDICGKHGVE